MRQKSKQPKNRTLCMRVDEVAFEKLTMIGKANYWTISNVVNVLINKQFKAIEKEKGENNDWRIDL